MRWLAVSLVVTFGAVAHADPSVDPTAPQDGDPFSIAEDDRLTLTIPHSYTSAVAIERLGYLFAYWKKRFNIASEWHGNRVFLTGSLYGIKIQALFAVTDSGVQGFARDPGWPWRHQVMKYVDRKVRKYLHPNYDEP
ncbi:MAG: hypothetical protein ACOZQL_32140 [Myxococcota bacterium]